MVSSHLLFSLIQCNAQYLRQLSRYFNQVIGDFGPHQTRCASWFSTPKIGWWKTSVVTRGRSIALCYAPLKSIDPPSYATVLPSSFAIITPAVIPPLLR